MTNSEPARAGGNQPGPDAAAIRIGDVDRNAAVTALGEHMSTGRLDLDEYGTRSALANTARTVGDLQGLFVDLPAPHPALPEAGTIRPAGRTAAGVGNHSGSGALLVNADSRSRAQKFVGAAAAASSIIALVLFFVTNQWWWFLLIPLISSVAGSIWGDSWKNPRNRR